MTTQPEALRLAELIDWPSVNYGHEAAAELRRLYAVNAELREVLDALLARDERNTCRHENTHRGGSIWEICDDCQFQWADDRGGKPEWKDPVEWVAARAAIAKAEGRA